MYISIPFQSGLKEVLSEEGGLDVRVYYLECMAQATYVVSHEGKAFIVDPRRDVDSFLVVREGSGWTYWSDCCQSQSLSLKQSADLPFPFFYSCY